MSYLQISHVEDNFYDDFAVHQYLTVSVADEQGNSILLQLLFYADSGTVIKALGAAHTLTGVYNGAHLIALVTAFLFERFGGDMQFLSEVFDGEDGGRVTLVMPIDTPNYAGA